MSSSIACRASRNLTTSAANLGRAGHNSLESFWCPWSWVGSQAITAQMLRTLGRPAADPVDQFHGLRSLPQFRCPQNVLNKAITDRCGRCKGHGLETSVVVLRNDTSAAVELRFKDDPNRGPPLATSNPRPHSAGRVQRCWQAQNSEVECWRLC